MKNIIQRNLPLDVKYTLINKQYVPLERGIGYCCHNCGRLISNIATVLDDKSNQYYIGFDCLETLLINNSLLSSDDIKDYEKVKKMIPKILKFAKTIKTNILESNVTGLKFDSEDSFPEYYSFYWLQNNETTSRQNDYIKLKDMNRKFFFETLKNIFPKLDIIY